MGSHEITKKVTIKDEDVDNILADAFHQGIAYWCDALRYDREPDVEVEYMSEALTKGAIIGIHDSEEDEWHSISLNMVLQAIADEQVDLDDYDNGVVDAVIQRAIFGEVVYG